MYNSNMTFTQVQHLEKNDIFKFLDNIEQSKHVYFQKPVLLHGLAILSDISIRNS